MNRDIESWKNEVMGSLQGMSRVEPEPYLLGSIMARLEEGTAKTIRLVPAPKVWMAAAALALLVSLNVWGITQNKSPNETARSAYQLDNVNYQLY